MSLRRLKKDMTENPPKKETKNAGALDFQGCFKYAYLFTKDGEKQAEVLWETGEVTFEPYENLKDIEPCFPNLSSSVVGFITLPCYVPHTYMWEHIAIMSILHRQVYLLNCSTTYWQF